MPLNAPSLLPIILLIFTTGLSLSQKQQQHDSGSKSGADSLRLIDDNPLLPQPRLKVYRGHWSPLLRQHLPINKIVTRTGPNICRVEVEEMAPRFSIAGHLEPKVNDNYLFPH